MGLMDRPPGRERPGERNGASGDGGQPGLDDRRQQLQQAREGHEAGEIHQPGPPPRGPPEPGAPEQRSRATRPVQYREVPPDGPPPPAGVRNIEAYEKAVVVGHGSVDDPMLGRQPMSSPRPPPSIGEYEREVVGGGRAVSRMEDEFLRYL